jgi:hypothetical protein
MMQLKYLTKGKQSNSSNEKQEDIERAKPKTNAAHAKER